MSYKVAIHNIEKEKDDYKIYTVDNPRIIIMDYLLEHRTNGYTVLFDQYYKNTRTTSFNQTFPFIKRNGEFEWHVPMKEVTIIDFAITHNIGEDGTIYINEGGVGGWGDSLYISEIITWALLVIDCFGRVFTLGEVAKYVKPIYDRLIGRDGKVASVNEVSDMLNTHREWTDEEVKSNLSGLDNNLIEALLLKQGFEKKGEKYIRKEGTINGDEEENHAKEFEMITDEYAYRRMALQRRVKELNNLLLSLFLQSEHFNTCDYEIMIKIVNKVIDENRRELRRGEGPIIIEFYYDGNEIINLEHLENEIWNLCKYTSYLCESIDEERDRLRLDDRV